jgi:carboxyl-terminal processing protease
MNTKKSLFSFILALGVSFILPSLAFASFSDVPENHPQYKAIQTLQSQKIIKGFADGTFRPEKVVSKAEFLKIIFSDIGYVPKVGRYETGFRDVPPEIWFAAYVKKALDLRLILPAQSEPDFHPDKAISKLEALKIAFDVEGIPAPYYTDIAPEDLFEDTPLSFPFAYLARAAKLHGLISSKTPELFTPFRTLTRGEMAEITYKMQLIRQSEPAGSIIIEPPESPEAPEEEPSTSPPSSYFEGLDNISAQFIDNPKFPILLDVWKKANTDFYYKADVNQNDLVYGAIEGLIEKLGDQYTAFQEPIQASQLADYLQGEFYGIGIQIDLIDNQVVIVKTISGSPAEKAGLKAGDIIKTIDSKDVNELTLEDLLKLLKGTEGTKVHLGILRQGKTYEFDVVRAKITINSVQYQVLNENIAYVAINQFTSSTTTEFTKALNVLIPMNPKGFIIDLRGNPGGYLDSAHQILGYFVAKGQKTVSTKRADGAESIFFSTGPAQLAQYPVYVLINAGTASASEIMAAAIQDYKVGKLLGEKSFGKGSVQQLYSYPDSSLLKITIAHWLTPLGRDISGVSLTPDIEVVRTKQDILNGKDPQLERALAEISH